MYMRSEDWCEKGDLSVCCMMSSFISMCAVPRCVSSLRRPVEHGSVEDPSGSNQQLVRPDLNKNFARHCHVLRAVAELHCVGFGWWVRRASVVEREATVAEDLGREREGGTYA